MFLSANASKRSLACSLRDPRGREAVLRLVDGADVFLQSLRPGSPSGSGSAQTSSAPGTRGSSTARSAPTGASGRSARSRATTR